MSTILTLSDLIHLSANNIDNLKNIINKKELGLEYKEDDNVILIYSLPTDNVKIDSLNFNIKSDILDKETLQLIAKQHNNMLINDEAEKYLLNEKLDWKKINISKAYEGTMLLMFYHNNKWYVTTRRCLDAATSIWANNISYYDLLMDAVNIDFTKLDQNLCYNFVLLHHKNQNLIDYTNEFGKNYKVVFHISTIEKYTMKHVDYKIEGCQYVQQLSFDSLADVKDALQKIDEMDEDKTLITSLGYILKCYNNNENNNNVTYMNIQTNLYNKLKKLKPNNSNIHQCYLELFQSGELPKYIKYFMNKHLAGKTITRYSKSLKHLSKEMLLVYFNTRNKLNQQLYSKLGYYQKKVLYDLHGIYKQRVLDKKNKTDEMTPN